MIDINLFVSGLRHTTRRSALMAPFYRGFEEKVRLDLDDIRGIQELYGAKPPPSDTSIFPKAAPSLAGDSPLCQSRQLDVITTDKEGRTLVFRVINMIE